MWVMAWTLTAATTSSENEWPSEISQKALFIMQGKATQVHQARVKGLLGWL